MRNVKNELYCGSLKMTKGGEREVYYHIKLTDVRITRDSKGRARRSK